MTGEELQERRSLSYRNRYIDLQSKSTGAFRYERVNDLLLVCIHRDIFLDYDKIIDVYASKYPRKILNPLSEN